MAFTICDAIHCGYLSIGTKTLFAGSSCNDVVAGKGLGTTVISGHFDRRIRFWDTRTATANEIALQGKVTSLDHYPGNGSMSKMDCQIFKRYYCYWEWLLSGQKLN